MLPKPKAVLVPNTYASAIAICDMLDRNPTKSMADLKDALPRPWSLPSTSPHCADETNTAWPLQW